jgi:hypothetical protein
VSTLLLSNALGTTFFSDDFESSNIALPVTGQAADTGQVWTDFTFFGSYPSFGVDTLYGLNFSQGAGTSGNPFSGNSVILGSPINSGIIILEMDLQTQKPGVGGAATPQKQFWLRDSAGGQFASIAWYQTNGKIWFEGLGISESPVDRHDSGFFQLTGSIHVTLNIDLDDKTVSYSWFDNADPSDPTTSGDIDLGTYAPAFAPDTLDIFGHGENGIGSGFDNIRIADVLNTGIINGQNSSITIDPAAHAQVVTAANDLAGYIQEITGTAIPIRIAGTNDPGGYHIRIGSTSEEPVDPAAVTEALVGLDGFIIKSVADGVIIAGPAFDGTRNGVYHFAEKILGCCWVSVEDDGPTCPQQPDIQIPALNMTEKPDRQWRGHYYSFQQLPGYPDLGHIAQKLSVNRDLWWTFNRSNSPGHVSFGAGHAWNTIIPKNVYFASNPEYFTLTDYTFAPIVNHRDPYTTRIHNLPLQRRCDNDFFQRNFGHPDVLQITIDYTRNVFNTDPDDFVGMGANDGPWWCISPEFLALGPSDPHRMLWFINAVATANETLYPDRSHMFFAYDGVGIEHIQPPSGMTVHANAVPVIAPLRLNRINSILSNEPDSVYLRQAIEGWGQVSSRIASYTYMNFGPFVTPGSASAVEEHRFFRDHGNIGGFREYQHLPRVGWQMINWIDAQCMWDADQDPNVLRRKFIEQYYSVAVADVLENVYSQIETRLRATTSAQWSEPAGPNDTANDNPDFWRPLVDDWRPVMNQALRLARPQPAKFRKRIEQDMLIVAGIAKDGDLTLFVDSEGEAFIWNTSIAPVSTTAYELWSTRTGPSTLIASGSIPAGSPLGSSEKVGLGFVTSGDRETDLTFQYDNGSGMVEGAVVSIENQRPETTQILLADDFESKSGALWGQNTDTGQTYYDPGWSVPSLEINTWNETSGFQGAGTSLSGGAASAVDFTKQTSGLLRLEAALSDIPSDGVWNGGNGAGILLSEKGGSHAEINLSSDSGVEISGLVTSGPTEYLDDGAGSPFVYVSGGANVVLDVDLDNKTIDFSWQGFTHVSWAFGTSGAVTGLSYAGAFSPDQIILSGRGGRSGLNFGGVDQLNVSIVQLARHGDSNLDDNVNYFDFSELSSSWHEPEGTLFWEDGDFDQNGTADLEDLRLMGEFWLCP